MRSLCLKGTGARVRSGGKDVHFKNQVLLFPAIKRARGAWRGVEPVPPELFHQKAAGALMCFTSPS